MKLCENCAHACFASQSNRQSTCAKRNAQRYVWPESMGAAHGYVPVSARCFVERPATVEAAPAPVAAVEAPALAKWQARERRREELRASRQRQLEARAAARAAAAAARAAKPRRVAVAKRVPVVLAEGDRPWRALNPLWVARSVAAWRPVLELCASAEAVPAERVTAKVREIGKGRQAWLAFRLRYFGPAESIGPREMRALLDFAGGASCSERRAA